MLFKVPAVPVDRSIAISGAIGAQVLIRVPGPVVNHVRIGPLDAPGFADGGPVVLRLTAENLGNVHRDYIAPDNLVVVAGRQKIDLPDFTVLRGSTRVVTARWLDPPLICICTLRVKTDDGMGHVVLVQARVVIFPVRLAAGALLVTVGLMLLLRRVRRARRERRHALIEQVAAEVYEHAQRTFGAGIDEQKERSSPGSIREA